MFFLSVSAFQKFTLVWLNFVVLNIVDCIHSVFGCIRLQVLLGILGSGIKWQNMSQLDDGDETKGIENTPDSGDGSCKRHFSELFF